MTIEKAIKLLQEKYEEAKTITYVHDPVAFALYYTWAEADGERLEKIIERT